MKLWTVDVEHYSGYGYYIVKATTPEKAIEYVKKERALFADCKNTEFMVSEIHAENAGIIHTLDEAGQ